MFQINNMTQMSCNFREQSKIVRMGEKMSQTKPPPLCHSTRGEARTARISCHSHQPNKLAKERGAGGVNRGLI